MVDAREDVMTRQRIRRISLYDVSQKHRKYRKYRLARSLCLALTLSGSLWLSLARSIVVRAGVVKDRVAIRREVGFSVRRSREELGSNGIEYHTLDKGLYY